MDTMISRITLSCTIEAANAETVLVRGE